MCLQCCEQGEKGAGPELNNGPDAADRPGGCADPGSVLRDGRGLSKGLSRGMVSDSLEVGVGQEQMLGSPTRRLCNSLAQSVMVA